MTDIIVAVLASGAVFSFVQFLITFGFSRADKSKEIEKKVDALSEKIDENQAINARVHLLRFADELRGGMKHSEEYYKQTLLDAKNYESYTQTHPDFSNGITELSIEFIKKHYTEEILNGKVESHK